MPGRISGYDLTKLKGITHTGTAAAAGTREVVGTGKPCVVWAISLYTNAAAQLTGRLEDQAGTDLWHIRTTATQHSGQTITFPVGLFSNDGLQFVIVGGTNAGELSILYSLL